MVSWRVGAEKIARETVLLRIYFAEAITAQGRAIDHFVQPVLHRFQSLSHDEGFGTAFFTVFALGVSRIVGMVAHREFVAHISWYRSTLDVEVVIFSQTIPTFHDQTSSVIRIVLIDGFVFETHLCVIARMV